MKIGTDSVLLGAWADCTECQHVLDIGTGTGILALMIAQRCGAPAIKALEPDQDAFHEALRNFESSPYTNRITCIQSSLHEFSSSAKFDFIISNPPFYSEEVSASGASRAMARQSSHLPAEALLQGADRLLEENGRLCLILPETSTVSFILLAAEYSLYLSAQCLVYPTENKPVHRRLMEFKRTRGPVRQDVILLRKAGTWSPEYRKLTESFYIRLS